MRIRTPPFHKNYISIKHTHIAVSFLLIIIAVALRLYPATNWIHNPDRYMFDHGQRALLTTVDGYYYLDIAQQLENGTYGETDYRRNIPTGHAQSLIPPLLSYITFLVKSVTSFNLETIATFLPPLLSAFTAVSIYILCCLIFAYSFPTGSTPTSSSLITSAFLASLFTLISPTYLERSAFGWYDTDVLNLCFPLIICILSLKFLFSHNNKERSFLILTIYIVFTLFLFWWDQTKRGVFLFSFFPLFFCMVTLLRQKKISFKICLLYLLPFILFAIFFLQPDFFIRFKKTFNYFTANDTLFRATALGVKEQVDLHFLDIIDKIYGNKPIFLLSTAGLFILIWRNPFVLLITTPLILVTLLAFKASRFALFGAPLVGLGVGYLSFYILQKIKFNSIAKSIIFLILIFLSLLSYQFHINDLLNRVPARSPLFFDYISSIKQKLPSGSLIWTTWGHGHPMITYTNYRVIADGMYHSSKLQFITNFPLYTSDKKLSANWISFFSKHGADGIEKFNKLIGRSDNQYVETLTLLKQLFSIGPQQSTEYLSTNMPEVHIKEVLDYTFPGDQNTTYLFIDPTFLLSEWDVIGSWNIEQQKSQSGNLAVLDIMTIKENEISVRYTIAPQKQFIIDYKTGAVYAQKGKINQLSRIITSNGPGQLNERTYENQTSNLQASLFIPASRGLAGSSDTVNSVMNGLYNEFLDNSAYFSFYDCDLTKRYCLWKVSGDKPNNTNE